MINITAIETVNFYNDPIDVAIDDQGMAYVSVGQITGYLGLDLETIIKMFDNDPRVELDFINDQAIVSLKKLNGFLMLLPYDQVQEEMKDDLLRYQVECFELLHDYWIHGVAINRRETPYDVTSKFKDERAVSRAALTNACANYCRDTEMDPSDLFDKVLGKSYAVIGLKPLHEYEKLTGAEAQYLAWVEGTYAKTISKFATWGDRPVDVVEEASSHVQNHLRETGRAWIAMADNMPASCYH
ncbi:anti-repressor Ant [Vibrio phage D148]